MSTARMRWGGLLTAGVLTLTLSACGGDDNGTAGSPTPATAASTPSDTSAEADVAQATTEESTASEQATSDTVAGQEISVADFVAMLQKPSKETLSTYTMSMTLKSSGGDMTMEGAVDLSGDQPLADMDMSVPGAGAMKMVMADGRIYLSMPGITEDGKFMEVPSDTLGAASDALKDIDVTDQFDTWSETAKKIVLVGEEDVDGETMRHYEVTMDGAVMAESMATAGESAGATADVPEDIVYNLWVDGDNLMRKIAFESEGMVTELRTDNWGEPQDIKAPSADE
ncbi:MAG: hypothetical protein Q4P07_11580, partial [Ornithinimicrobium sp.]|nr:hypothetical protein [Ornithinimicrobium sp.]